MLWDKTIKKFYYHAWLHNTGGILKNVLIFTIIFVSMIIIIIMIYDDNFRQVSGSDTATVLANFCGLEGVNCRLQVAG